jgi:pimeloyl-ACP methyl ester carboxylesterase
MMDTVRGVLTFGVRPLRRRYGRPPRRPVTQPPPGALDVALPGARGETLRAWLLAGAAHTSDGPGPAAVVMHGWGASAADMLPVAQPLLAAGLHVLLLDAGGHGRSDDVEFSSMPAFADDVTVGLHWLQTRPEVDPTRIVLVGHSVGAGACLLVASRDPSIAAVISVASMAHPREFMSRALRTRLPAPLVPVALRVVERSIGHRFDSFAPINTIGQVRAPVLLLHGAGDSTVPVADAYALREHAPPDSSLLVVDDADHTSVEALDHVASALHGFLHAAGITPPGVSLR